MKYLALFFLINYSILGQEVLDTNQNFNSNDIESHTVSIVNTANRFQCSGTLIAKNMVLTAGHCITKNLKIILFGKSGFYPSAGRTIIKGIAHPRFKMPTQYENRFETAFDIGVIIFKGSMPEGFSPATIIPNDIVPEDKETLMFAGYGVDLTSMTEGILKEMPLELMSYNSDPLETEMSFSQPKEHTVCRGDSGGPSYMSRNKELYLVGVTSRVNSGGDEGLCSLFAVSTKVSAHMKWINKTMEILKDEL